MVFYCGQFIGEEYAGFKLSEKAPETGESEAQAEKDYRIALSKKMLIERDNGMPVSIISDVCRGSEEVAELKFKRDCAKANYESVQEAVNVYKLQIKVLENQIDREWRG